MSHPILQIWGGVFYLLNKIFLAFAEKSEGRNPTDKRWRIWAWVVYLIGTPPWVAIFVMKRNWIAAALEVGGIPAMILGLIIALRGKGKEPQWLHWIAIGAIALGLGYSLYDFGGFKTLNQTLELAIVSGLLVGTYLLAEEQPSGYLWFIFMCSANTVLMWRHQYPWLVAQQIVSLAFIGYAYYVQKQKVKR
jgi:hypothetical protein